MIMPSVDNRDVESSEFQHNFIMCGGLKLMFHVLTSSDCLSKTDNTLKRYMYMYMYSCIYTVYRNSRTFYILMSTCTVL